MSVKVVIAEDEPIIKMDIREILESRGYDVVGEASDGYDVVEICRSKKPDLVIMDIKMPLFDGLKAAEVIKNEKLARCVMLLTAYSDKAMLEQAKKANVMGYLIKPVAEASLVPAIEIALAKQDEIDAMEQDYQKTKAALESRKVVEKAKGILMKRDNLSEEEAYSYLRKVAMSKACTIADIAKIIIASEQ